MNHLWVLLNLKIVDPWWTLLGATLEDPLRSSSLSSSSLSNDPLVNHDWENLTHLAAIALIIGIVAAVGIVSKKVEHAIAAALLSSLVVIGFFFLAGR